MNTLGQVYTHRSYENVDPFEINDSNHVIRIDREIKAQLGTGAKLVSIELKQDMIIIHLDLQYTSAPDEWPIGTKLHLIYSGAKIEANPINEEDDKFENISDIDSYQIFELNDKEKQEGYSKAIELSTDSGLWDIYYDTAEVKFELPK
jgi:hypothetical protein